MQRPAVMGIVNVTPDSFSDGGVHLDPDVAAAAARRMVEEGAAIVDVGGESTRPGSEGVSLDEELRRVVPVLERLEGVPVSIDTAKSEVARRALELGAELVNDVTALRGDPELAGVVADARRVPLPDAHAGRAAHDAGRPALRRRRRRGGGVPRGAAVRAPSRPGSRRSASASTRASASARPPSTDFELRAAARRAASRSAARCSSGSRARARSAGSSTRRRAPGRSRPRSAPRSPPTSAARRSSASTTSASTSRRSRRRGPYRVMIELDGIALHGFHGVLDGRARATGSASSSTSRSRSDEPALRTSIEDAVDYRDVAACVREVSDGARVPPARGARGRGRRRADARASRSSASRVRVRKPDVVLDPPVEYAAVARRRARDARVRRPRRQPRRPRGDDPRGARRRCPGVVAVSTLRETDPVGVVDQPPFLNGAAALETELAAARAARRAARGRARARPRARRALGAAHDRPRPAALRRRDDRRAGPDRPASAPARAPVRARAAARARSGARRFPAAARVADLLAGLH